jgi:hypothetical protein
MLGSELGSVIELSKQVYERLWRLDGLIQKLAAHQRKE